jgi:hypothetical protein
VSDSEILFQTIDPKRAALRRLLLYRNFASLRFIDVVTFGLSKTSESIELSVGFESVRASRRAATKPRAQLAIDCHRCFLAVGPDPWQAFEPDGNPAAVLSPAIYFMEEGA